MVSCIFTFVLSCPVTPALIFLNHLTNRKCLSLHISAPKPPVCPSFAGKYVPEFLPQHPLTQSGLTMPSCYGIACLAKRHSSGSGWQITKHENKSCNPADFGSSCSACILILDRFGKVRQTETETQVDFFFLLFLQETHSSCTVPWFSSVYNLSISVSKNAELTSSAPLDRNLQCSRKLFFSSLDPYHAGLLGLSHCHVTQDPQGHWRKQDFLNCSGDLPACVLCQGCKINPWIVLPPQILHVETHHYTKGKIVEDN